MKARRTQGQVFTAPASPKRGRYLNPYGKRHGIRCIDVPCPACEAEVGVECTVMSGPNAGDVASTPHPLRRRMAQRKRNEINLP